MWVAPTASNKKLTQASQTSAADTLWKPFKYTGLSLFIPQNGHEEIILLLQISEALPAHDAVLSQPPDLKEARICACDNTTAIYDLLTIALIR
jgi:hypothetical protein